MKSTLILLLQVALVLILLYAIFGPSKSENSSASFEKEFESKGYTFRVPPSSKTPDHENPSDPDPNPNPREPPQHPPTDPSKEPQFPKPPGPSHDPEYDPTFPPKENPSNDPHPNPSKPDEPKPPKPQEPPQEEPRDVDFPPSPKDDQETEPLPDLPEVDWTRETPLRKYPLDIRKDPGKRSKRKSRGNELLCKITGKGCIRAGPTEELPHLWFILALYSPNQQKVSRLYEMHNYFVSYIHLYGIKTQVIEIIFPGQNYLATKPNNAPYELQYKSEWAFNMRENLVNVGSKHLPDDWDNIAWVDAHVVWDGNPYWFEDLIVQLSRNNMVHMFKSQTMQTEHNQTRLYLESVGYLWTLSHTMNFPPARQWGMAWATRRDVFEALGGSMDICVAGKCDLYQCYAYFGQVWTGDMPNAGYANAVRDWQQNAIGVVRGKVGYIPANLIHFEHCSVWEGCQTSSYNLMSDTLKNYNFNPVTDLKRDSEGRLEFKGNWPLAKAMWGIYGGNPK